MYFPVTLVRPGSNAAYKIVWQPSFGVLINNHLKVKKQILANNDSSISKDLKWFVSCTNPGLTAFTVILYSNNNLLDN